MASTELGPFEVVGLIAAQCEAETPLNERDEADLMDRARKLRSYQLQLCEDLPYRLTAQQAWEIREEMLASGLFGKS